MHNWSILYKLDFSIYYVTIISFGFVDDQNYID